MMSSMIIQVYRRCHFPAQRKAANSRPIHVEKTTDLDDVQLVSDVKISLVTEKEISYVEICTNATLKTTRSQRCSSALVAFLEQITNEANENSIEKGETIVSTIQSTGPQLKRGEGPTIVERTR